MVGRIAFQGELGANSHEACNTYYPDYEPVPHPTFEAAFEAIKSGDCQLGMIPVENSIAGRVADVHHLLPASGLKIMGNSMLFAMAAGIADVFTIGAACGLLAGNGGARRGGIDEVV